MTALIKSDCMPIPLSDAEKPSAQSTPSEESPSILVNGVGSGMVNGHIPLRKRFIESSLDELAMELEAYEQGEQKPKTHDDHVNDTQEIEDLHTEPELSPVIIAADEAETSRDTEQMEDESERAIVELLKLSGEVWCMRFIVFACILKDSTLCTGIHEFSSFKAICQNNG